MILFYYCCNIGIIKQKKGFNFAFDKEVNPNE